MDWHAGYEAGWRIGTLVGYPIGILMGILLMGVLPMYLIGLFSNVCIKKARSCLSDRTFVPLLYLLPLIVASAIVFAMWGVMSVQVIGDVIVSSVRNPIM